MACRNMAILILYILTLYLTMFLRQTYSSPSIHVVKYCPGSNVTLTCRTSSLEDQPRWKQCGSTQSHCVNVFTYAGLVKNRIGKYSVDDNCTRTGECTLTVHGLHPNDSGIYTCTEDNSGGRLISAYGVQLKSPVNCASHDQPEHLSGDTRPHNSSTALGSHDLALWIFVNVLHLMNVKFNRSDV